MTNTVKVLCVDDEPQLLEGLMLNLRRRYITVAAQSAASALEILDKEEPFAVVLSDLRMPGEDGITFLERVRQRCPDTIRMLLTGHADLDTAIAAVNRGQLFRFLTKPCPPDQLLLAFKAAAEQYRLVTAERVLLEQTLHGSVKTLVDVLSLTNPVSFGRAMRIKKHVSDLADELGLRERWQVEVAAMLSQLGCITLPAEVAEKLCFGQSLDARELELVNALPQVTERLLENIPRLEVVREILAKALGRQRHIKTNSDESERKLVDSGAKLLRVAFDFDELEAFGSSADHAIAVMRSRPDKYDAKLLDSLAKLRCTGTTHDEVRELPIAAVREGMTLAEDLKLSNGTLLAARGYEVTTGFVERARHFQSSLARRLVRVIVHR